ncbi:MAG: hypothetical protein M1816_004656 [Peltula sp. TS41687]|nr:MAG: hypothetical protein M1816_004656 [Peltula sp. TS41687]
MFSEDPLPPFSFEPLSPSPRDVIVSDSESESQRDPHERSTKRRRVEEIARQYVAGQPVYILSASLKGPFNPSWRNPWSKPSSSGPSGPDKLRLKQTRPKSSINSRTTPRRGAKVEHYPKSSNVTPKSLNINESRRDSVVGKIERREHTLSTGVGRGTRGPTHDGTPGSTRWADDHDIMMVDYQSTPNTVTRAGILNQERKDGSGQDGRSSSSGNWLKVVKGSAYSYLPAQDDTASLSPEKVYTPTERISSKRKRTQSTDTSHQGLRPVESNRYGKSRDEFTVLDEPLELTPEGGVVPSTLASQRKPSDFENQPGCAAQLPTQNEGADVVVNSTDLVEASAETIQFWMRAKELSMLAASQASRAASFRQSNSPSVARLSHSLVEAVDDVRSTSQPIFIPRASLVSDDSEENSLERFSHSQPDPFKPKTFEPDDAAGSFPARSSRATSGRKSYRVVSPSTALPGFRYWRAKSATAQKSPSKNAETAQRAALSKMDTGGAKPPSPEESDDALTGEHSTDTMNTKTNKGNIVKQDARSLAVTSVDVPTSMVNTPSMASSPWLTPRAAKPEHGQAMKLRRHFTPSSATNGQPKVEAHTVDKLTDTAQMSPNRALVKPTTPAGDFEHRGNAQAALKNEDVSGTESPEIVEPALSTQAAVTEMQRRFQAEIETPAPHKLVTSPTPNSTGKQRKEKVETPEREPASSSPLFVRNSRGLRTPSGDEATSGKASPQKEFISTQMLLEAASPFEISTIIEVPRLRSSVDSDMDEHSQPPRRSTRIASKGTSPETPASALRPGQHHLTPGRADHFRQSKSAMKEAHATTLPGATMMQFGSPGEDNAAELDTTIGEMMGGILQSWDVETELKKGATSHGLKDTGKPAGRRRASRTDQII